MTPAPAVHATQNFLRRLRGKPLGSYTGRALCGVLITDPNALVSELGADALLRRELPPGRDIACPACEARIFKALVARLLRRKRRKLQLAKRAAKRRRQT